MDDLAADRPPPALGTRDAGVEQRQGGVGHRVDPRQQVEALEDEADLAVADLGELVVANAEPHRALWRKKSLNSL